MKTRLINLEQFGGPAGKVGVEVIGVTFRERDPVILASDPETVLAFAPARDILPEGNEVLASGEFVWMPAGKHSITAGTTTGKPFRGEVIVDEIGARAVIASFQRTQAAGRPAWIDFDHEDSAAAAWVKGFRWDAARGIVASVEWTPAGKRALEERQYRSFSPAFTLDPESKRPSGIYEGHAAGGLVNAPAFGAAMPALIAARLGGTESTTAAGGHPVNPNLVTTMPPENKSEQVAPAAAAPVVTASAPAAAPASVDLAPVLAAVAELKNEIAAIKAAKPAAPVAPVVVPVVPTEQPVVTASAKPNAFEAIRAFLNEKDNRKRGAIYCADIRDFVVKTQRVMEVLAANSFGTAAGDLIVLRSLDLLKLSFPVLGAISTDFSDQQARQGQSIKTRIVSVPSVVTLDDATGWSSSDATTTDVSVTIGQPKGVQIELTSSEIAGTSRDLFAEQVEACHYALGKAAVDALYTVITSGNFSNATTKATASVARLDFVAMEKALAIRGVEGVRYVLANADIYERLSLDSTLVNLATYNQPEVITGTGLPPVAGFNVIRAINLPTTGNLTAFGFRKDALVLATRVPEDYASALPGAAHGSLSVVTNPDTGISVQKVDFVDHKLAKAYSRIAISYGVAKGNGSSGQRLISA